MLNCMKMVTAFHRKYGFSVGVPLPASPELGFLGARLLGESRLLVPASDASMLRVHLVVEEAGELASALAEANPVEALDALADLCYVAVGTAVTFGLPLAEAFAEVHASNMTKTVVRDRPGHPGKGPGYRPPDLAALLGRSE